MTLPTLVPLDSCIANIVVDSPDFSGWDEHDRMILTPIILLVAYDELSGIISFNGKGSTNGGYCNLISTRRGYGSRLDRLITSKLRRGYHFDGNVFIRKMV
jgi:hypothetical protein